MIKLFTPLFVFINRAVVGILIFVLVVPASIIAFYSDIEKLDNQNFTATELRFANVPKAPSLQYFSPVLQKEFDFNLPTAFTASSTKALYDISSAVSGNLDFCASLRLTAEGYLGSISAGAPHFATAPLNSGSNWQVKLGYNPASTSTNFAHGDKCDVTLTVEGWQENMTKATAGYRDAYSVTIPVVAQLVVLNEVLAKPTPGNYEFIELYNHSTFPVDVAGFNITELTASGNITNHIIKRVPTLSSDLVAYDGSGNTVIPAHGFLAFKYKSSTYLNDTGDTITLLDTDNITLDAYTFGQAITNKSDARIPDGIGSWIDPVPTPNEPNVVTEDEAIEILPEAYLAEVLSEEIIVINDAVASGTEPVIIKNDENGLGEEEIIKDVKDEAGEAGLVDDTPPAPGAVTDEEGVEPEMIEEESVEDEVEVKIEETKEEEPEEEEETEEDEEVIEEIVI